VTALILAAALTLSAAAQPADPSSDPRRPWTILVYGAADNNADGPILGFLNGVRAAVDDDPGLDLLLFIDRSERYSKDARSLGQDFTGARLYRLRSDSAERLPGGEHFPQITLDSDAELDSADASNIRRFIAWGKAQSPARRYALLIYSHADGRTMCPDEHTETEMGIAELTDEAGAAESVDFLALELCNMGGIEIAYQWRPGTGRFGADVLLAIPNAGPPLDWDRAFRRIRTPGHETPVPFPTLDPAEMTAADFGRLVIEEGHQGRIDSGHGAPLESAACYDLAAAAPVKESVDALARALAGSDSKAVFGALRGAASGSGSGAINYTRGGPYVDLYDLCSRAASADGLSEGVRAAADAVMRRVDDMVIDSFGMDGYTGFEPGRSGVFIVLPAADAQGGWKKLAWYTPREAGHGHYGRWSFLADGATPGNGVVENWFELMDSWFDEPGSASGTNGYAP
jgi:clostripain